MKDIVAADFVCGACGSRTTLSPIVSVVQIHAPGLARPYPLIPSEEYQVCTTCNALLEFVTKAAESHPETREARVGPWTKAVVVYDDGDGAEVHPGRKPQARA